MKKWGCLAIILFFVTKTKTFANSECPFTDLIALTAWLGTFWIIGCGIVELCKMAKAAHKKEAERKIKWRCT